MSNETRTLGAFAAGLAYEDIPAAVVDRAKECIIDTIGAAIFGSTLPWSRIVIDYARANGATGDCTVLGANGLRAAPPMAALANGVMAHAFEMDSLRQPSAGIHPGATLVPSGLAVGEQVHASGRDLITAFIAANEVMSRIGLAAKHTSEQLGFHAPGMTGPLGSALVAGRLMGLDADRMANAMGIAGSLCGGILEFVRSGTGGMVKRLHLGRAAESGVLAAGLARDGFTGPTTVLEGEFGVLNVFCRDADPSLLTDGLGERFETLNLCLKRFPCHITAHTPVQAMLDFKAQYGFTGNEIDAVTVRGSEKMVTHHAITEPSDVMLGQYSTPFCVALAALKDPMDPRAFSEATLADDAVRSLCRKIRVEELSDNGKPAPPWVSVVEVTLKDGRRLERRAESFKGMPDNPVSPSELAEKFNLLTREAACNGLLDRLLAFEKVKDVWSLLAA